jgi:hypothetical protein
MHLDSRRELDCTLVHADDGVQHMAVPWGAQAAVAETVRLECTADLQADTLSFAWNGIALSAVSIPRLRECFIYAASEPHLDVELQPCD